MRSGSEYNTIDKNEAISFMRSSVNGRDKNYVINALVNCTLYGAEYPAEQRHGHFEMSYYCRAYNITEYNATKQRNRIKGRYRKYANVPGMEQYLRQILLDNWPGFRTESPRMDDLIKNFANGNVQPQPQPRRQPQQEPPVTSYRPNGAPAGGSDTVASVVGLVVLVAIIAFLLKSCGGASSGGGSFFSNIIDKLITLGSYILALIAIGLPIVEFFMRKVWRNLGGLIGGIILFMISYSCFSSGMKYSVILAIVFWFAGIAVWEK